MKIRKAQGRAGVGEYYWPFDGAVIEVDGDTGNELINLKGADFTSADFEEENLPPSETIPAGAQEITRWAAGNQQRALRALVAEERLAEPRLRLMVFLRNVVNAEPGALNNVVTDQDIEDRAAAAVAAASE